jgi:hypothetical protein
VKTIDQRIEELDAASRLAATCSVELARVRNGQSDALAPPRETAWERAANEYFWLSTAIAEVSTLCTLSWDQEATRFRAAARVVVAVERHGDKSQRRRAQEAFDSALRALEGAVAQNREPANAVAQTRDMTALLSTRRSTL